MKNLIQKAIEVREKAYAPYSHFKVGALVVADNGKEYCGVNVENASYGLTNCAERSAIFSAIADGANRIQKVFIVADTIEPISPCGACRQVISEFCDSSVEVIMANLNGKYTSMTVMELLPGAFKL